MAFKIIGVDGFTKKRKQSKGLRTDSTAPAFSAGEDEEGIAEETDRDSPLRWEEARTRCPENQGLLLQLVNKYEN